MSIKAKLQFTNGMSWNQEYKLIHEGGFRVVSRSRVTDILIMEKETPKAPSSTQFEMLVNGELPQTIQMDLRRQCNRVICMYSKPHDHIPAIKTRLNNIAATKPKHQQKFIQIWIQNNIDGKDAFKEY